ncbi:MAG: hypothetical protein ACOX63_01225 [Christensenellales bacterium]
MPAASAIWSAIREEKNGCCLANTGRISVRTGTLDRENCCCAVRPT